MSGDGLLHIGFNGELVSMAVTPYEAEEILQGLLETHPDLLAGGQNDARGSAPVGAGEARAGSA